MSKVNIFWFRRDLRLEDNHGLYMALSSGLTVLPIFIFDTNILDHLEDRADPRVSFIYQEVIRLKEELEKAGSSLLLIHGTPEEVFRNVISQYEVHTVFANHDYEPYARERDEKVSRILAQNGIIFQTFKDQVILEKDEVLKDDGTPYTVFTPYSKRWKTLFDQKTAEKYPSEKLKGMFFKTLPIGTPSLPEIGYEMTSLVFPERKIDPVLISNYDKTRDIPSLPGTSRLSVHLRFGTISIRKLAEMSSRLNPVFLNELVWRDFYMMILWHFPHVAERSFKPAYDHIAWKNREDHFEAWCEGRTGYPIVDAGMRELNHTGFMHNRLRMITASFLTKHLLTDWRWGEAYFAKKLLDSELSSNNGGWQWAAGTGCDAAPYFRIFNPTLQAQKFDPENKYILRWVPEYRGKDYPGPIVIHEQARAEALRIYKKSIF
jgi:deoxyribodipyrimidine photo-lyase